MTTDCADLRTAVIVKLLEAGFSEEELELDVGKHEKDHDAILRALAESRMESESEHSLVVLGEFVLQAIRGGYDETILHEMDLSDEGFYRALRESGLTQVHRSLRGEIA